MTQANVVMVTPEMAQDWLLNSRYEHQRAVTPTLVTFLAEEMRMGEFKQDTPIEFTAVGKDEFLTDGQHRLSAIVVCQIPQRFVVIRRYVDSATDAALDYNRTDQGKPRTIAEQYKTLQIEEELQMPFTQVNNLGTAVQFINMKFGHRNTARMHPKIRLTMMREYAPACKLYLDAIAGVKTSIRSRLERRASMSVAIVTFRYSVNVYGEQKVFEFWNGIAADDGLKAKDSRKAAINHLTEYVMEGGAAIRSGRKGTPEYSARYIAGCFGAYLGNKEIFRVVPDVTKPIVIAGSPFAG